MIGVLDLTARGLAASALERSGTAFARAHDVDAANTLVSEGSAAALVVELDSTTPPVCALLEGARAGRVPVLVISREHAVASAVETLRAGASDYLTTPFELESFLDALDRLRRASAGASGGIADDAFLTCNADMLATLELARSVAPSDATVLIEGESGTGKELLARLIHAASARGSRRMISVNCAALPAGLLESELFGHERGAFTGAFARVIGKFELAHGTTLLLDEIGELELALQAKLLRVIQERQVQRVGARLPVDVDFRLVATTNRALAIEARAGRFREDLYYRLNVLPVRLAPLRERREDIRFLAEHLAERQVRDGRTPAQLSEASLLAMESYDWPGNVRELENMIERLALISPGRIVEPHELGFARGLGNLGQERRVSGLDASTTATAIPSTGTIREMERWLIVETLKRREGNRTQAARDLGISLRTLRNKINDYTIDDPDTLPRTGTARAGPSPRVARSAGRQEVPTPGARA